MLCTDCKKEIPFSPYIIRCKKCYAMKKQGEPMNNSWINPSNQQFNKEPVKQMKCLDCNNDIPQSTYFVRCKPCFSKMKKLEPQPHSLPQKAPLK